MSAASSRETSRVICRCCSRPSSNWSSISRPRGRLASTFPRRCSLAPTRSSNETPRLHLGSRRRGGSVAAGGARAAADWANRQDATPGHVDAGPGCAFGSYLRSILPRAARTRLHRGTEPDHRAARRGLEIGSAPCAGGRTRWAEGRHHCGVEHADGPSSQASHQLDPDHRGGHGRSRRRRARRQPGTAGR